MVQTVIIDDDYVSRKILRELLKNFPECEILGEAGSVTDGIKLINDASPELILLDISLPDGTGFDLLDKLPENEYKIIFTTAYSDYALKAFEYSTFDYLIKPINLEGLTKAFMRIPQFQKPETNHRSLTLNENLSVPIEKNPNTVALPEPNGFAIIRVEDIIRCEGKRNYTRIIFKEGTEKIVSRTLLEFETLLTPLGFIRIHRSHLVNIFNVVRYIKSDGGMVELKTGEKLKVSPKHKDNLFNKILSNKL
jgi:two-component system LytT family response regulator